MCLLEDALGPEDFSEAPRAAMPARVGDYELLAEIARGGMGVVWRARQRRLKREVALKFVLEGALPGEVVARRFRQEAEVAAQLSHPHIVSIYEVGEADGRYFLCMELAEGGNLAQRLARGPFAPRAAAELAVKLARAVQHAHDRGVLHRDLKPANVLFDRAGEPRVTDFGLARLVTARGDMTLAGALMGTPSYMSPEQAGGKSEELTIASDIYGLGAILYEMLSGRPPFAGEVPMDVLRRVIDDEPPRLVGVERDLETICLTCLAKRPEARYRSAHRLAEDLVRWLAGEPIQARRASAAERVVKWMRRHPLLTTLWLALAGAVFVSAGVIVASQVRVAAARGAAQASSAESLHRRADQHTTAAILALESGDSLRALPSLAEAIRIGTGDPIRDRVNRIRFETILRLAPKLEQMWFPRWLESIQMEPGWQRMIVCGIKDLHVVDLHSGRELNPPMEYDEWIAHAAFHPTLGRIVAETKSGALLVWDATTGQQLIAGAGSFLKDMPLFVNGSPQLALWRGKEAWRFSVAKPGNDGATLSHPAPVEWAYLCADGRRIVTWAADRQLRVWDGETGTVIGAPIPCPEETHLLAEKPDAPEVLVQTRHTVPWRLDVEHGTRGASLVVSGDFRAAGWLAGQPFLATATRDGFVISAGNDGEVFITAMLDAHGNDAAFSSEGSRVFTRAVNGSSRLWSLQSSRALTPCLWEGADPIACFIDGEGQRILMASQEPAIRLWHLEERGGAVSETLTSLGARARDWLQAQKTDTGAPPFHRDSVHGSPILDVERSSLFSLHVRDASSGQNLFPPLRHQARVLQAIFSPDGRRIASYAGNQCAYLWDAKTGEQIGPLLRHTREIDTIAFSPDGTLLLSVANTALQVWETATGMLASPPMQHPDSIRRAWWKADGTAIFTVDKRGLQREWNLAPGDRPAADLATLGHLYSSHRVTTGGALIPLGVEETQAAWEAAKKMQSR